MSIKLKITIGILAMPVLWLLMVISVKACEVGTLRNVEYVARAGAVCRRVAATQTSPTRIRFRFNVDNPGCDWTYEFRSDTNKYRVSDYSNTGPWRDADLVLRNRWAAGTAVNFDGSYTNKFAIFNIEDGGDTGNLNPGNIDGELYFNIDWVNCACPFVPTLSPNYWDPTNYETSVALGSQNNVLITFGDSNGTGDGICNTAYRIFLTEHDTNTFLGSSQANANAGRYRSNFNNLKPATWYRWYIEKASSDGTFRYTSPNYFFQTEQPSPIKLMTANSVVSASSILNYSYDRFEADVAIKRNSINGPTLFELNEAPYLSNALIITKEASTLVSASRIGAILANYSDSNPLNGNVPDLYTYYLNRASSKRAPNGNDVVTQQSSEVILRYNNANGIVSQGLNDSTPSDTSSIEAVVHVSDAIPQSLEEQDVRLNGSWCASDAVHFINGDLYINPPFYSVNLANENIKNYCMFIIKGDLYIEPGTNAPANADLYDIIEAYFIVNGETFVRADAGNGLYIRGGLVTNQLTDLDADGDPITGTTGLNRDISSSFQPSHIIDYDPAFVQRFRDILGSRKYSLR